MAASLKLTLDPIPRKLPLDYIVEAILVGVTKLTIDF